MRYIELNLQSNRMHKRVICILLYLYVLYKLIALFMILYYNETTQSYMLSCYVNLTYIKFIYIRYLYCNIYNYRKAEVSNGPCRV